LGQYGAGLEHGHRQGSPSTRSQANIVLAASSGQEDDTSTFGYKLLSHVLDSEAVGLETHEACGSDGELSVDLQVSEAGPDLVGYSHEAFDTMEVGFIVLELHGSEGHVHVRQ
jgi:hypothetical protein